MGCSAELPADHTGIICVGDHHICPECSQNFVNTVFDEPAERIPLKCMLCRASVVVETFERQLTTQQVHRFLQYNMQFDSAYLDETEFVAACPFCNYFEISTVDEGRLLFLCKNPECKKPSCILCKKSIRNNGGDDDEKYDLNQHDVESHFECAKWAPFRKKWEQALSDGSTRKCPQCELRGMKNNACSHMTCVGCKTVWCYVCGLKLEDLDKADSFGGVPMAADNIFGHNEEWETNPRRCPMWLNTVHEVDGRWPRDDGDESVYFMHRLLTMQMLKDVIDEMGNDNFQALCDTFRVHETCGFDIDAVRNGNHQLIIRRNQNSRCNVM